MTDWRQTRPLARLPLAACALGMVFVASAAASADTHVVEIDAMQFRAQTLRVRSGDRITWINKDLVPHTATGAPGTFDSGNIPSGSSWTFVAPRPGRYPYHCTFHPPMKGELIVE